MQFWLWAQWGWRKRSTWRQRMHWCESCQKSPQACRWWVLNMKKGAVSSHLWFMKPQVEEDSSWGSLPLPGPISGLHEFQACMTKQGWWALSTSLSCLSGNSQMCVQWTALGLLPSLCPDGVLVAVLSQHCLFWNVLLPLASRNF